MGYRERQHAFIQSQSTVHKRAVFDKSHLRIYQRLKTCRITPKVKEIASK